MTLQWMQKYVGIGNSLGYTTLANNFIHNLARLGVKFDKSHVLVHLIPTHYFTAFRFAYNVLFTMSEFEQIPRTWETRVNSANLIIVPCEQNRRIYEDVSYGPAVELCPLGVDTNVYPFYERDPVPEIFTFLYVGDYNARKGTYHIAKSWEEWDRRYPELREKTQLIMKMTAPEKDGLEQITCNSFFDWRLLPYTAKDNPELPTLASLYKMANAFVFPSMGEGFGLTLAEAMATGLPCIYTPWTGLNDVAGPAVAYPIEFGMKRVELIEPVWGVTDTVRAADPRIDSIVDRMHEIYTDYDAALETGRRAAAYIAHRFPWDHAAHQFIDIIEKHCGGMTA